MAETDGPVSDEHERQVEVAGHTYRLRALPSSSEEGWVADVVGYAALDGARVPTRDLPGVEPPTRDPARLLGRMRMGGSSPDEALNRLAEQVGDTIAEAARGGEDGERAGG